MPHTVARATAARLMTVVRQTRARGGMRMRGRVDDPHALLTGYPHLRATPGTMIDVSLLHT